MCTCCAPLEVEFVDLSIPRLNRLCLLATVFSLSTWLDVLGMDSWWWPLGPKALLCGWAIPTFVGSVREPSFPRSNTRTACLWIVNFKKILNVAFFWNLLVDVIPNCTTLSLAIWNELPCNAKGRAVHKLVKSCQNIALKLLKTSWKLLPPLL